MATYPDITIAEGLKRADPKILKFLWDEFAPRLQYFAENIIRDTQEAEDIVATVFEILYSSGGRFDSMATVKSFLYITTRNRCIDFLRRKQRQPEVRFEDETQQLEIPEPDDTDRIGIRTELIHAVYKAIEELPLGCRQVFIMTYLEGMNAREISEKLGISVSTVTTQRSRAIHYLRKVLPLKEYITLMFLLGSIP